MKNCYFDRNPYAQGGYAVPIGGGRFLRGCRPYAKCNGSCTPPVNPKLSPRYSSQGEYSTSSSIPKVTSSSRPPQADRGRDWAYHGGGNQERASSSKAPRSRRASVNLDGDRLAKEFGNIKLGRSQSTRRHIRPSFIDMNGNKCDLAEFIGSSLFKMINRRSMESHEEYPFPIRDIDRLPLNLSEGYAKLATIHTADVKFEDALSSAESYLKEYKYLDATRDNRMNTQLLEMIISNHKTHIEYHLKDFLVSKLGFSDDELDAHEPDMETMRDSLIHYTKALSFIDLCGKKLKGSMDTVLKNIRELEALPDHSSLSFSELAEVKTTEFVLRELLRKKGLLSSANLPAVLLYAKLTFWDEGDFNSGSLPVIMQGFHNCQEELSQENYDLIRDKLKDTILRAGDMTSEERRELLGQINYGLNTFRENIFELESYYSRRRHGYVEERKFIGIETTTSLMDNETGDSEELHRSFMPRSQTI